eukprot:356997-Chlamydomonas_euryale.AAC.2
MFVWTGGAAVTEGIVRQPGTISETQKVDHPFEPSSPWPRACACCLPACEQLRVAMSELSTLTPLASRLRLLPACLPACAADRGAGAAARGDVRVINSQDIVA